MKFEIKICGITRAEDAILAESFGATAIGFIFTHSPRKISTTQARLIGENLKPQTVRVGIFAQSNLNQILSGVEEANLSAVQLHGQETLELVEDLRLVRPSLKIFKAIEVTGVESLLRANDYNVDYLLLDSPRGSEEREPLSVRDVQRVQLRRPFLIAGGLTPFNVRSYLSSLKPNGVDICSGLESEPGVKCPQKMKMFFQALQHQDGLYGT